MRVPVLHGVIERRLLVNYRVAPDALADILPPPFRPKLVDGYAIAGICLTQNPETASLSHCEVATNARTSLLLAE